MTRAQVTAMIRLKGFGPEEMPEGSGKTSWRKMMRALEAKGFLTLEGDTERLWALTTPKGEAWEPGIKGRPGRPRSRTVTLGELGEAGRVFIESLGRAK